MPQTPGVSCRHYCDDYDADNNVDDQDHDDHGNPCDHNAHDCHVNHVIM